MLKLYNTLTRIKEPLTPVTAGHIGLYVCGMTVYDDCHIGHARVWIIFDMLVRYLKHLNRQVHYVRNITDIDDKIIKRAQQNNETIHSLTKRMIDSMHADMHALNLLPPSKEPRATDYIPQMVSLIKTLIAKGYAYQTASGDVYYAINQFKNYGQLAHQDLSELISGARVAIDQQKQHPLDFVLWKKNTGSDLIGWDSPWGLGRPGWHIECSTMALEHLNTPFDIHGGGIDLQFPHHQNEIAQSEAVTGKTFVRTWMHVGFVQVQHEKMSKSLGNALSLKTVLKQYPGEVIRYFLLTSHYRSPISYDPTRIATAQKSLERLYAATHYADPTALSITSNSTSPHPYENAFHQALQDDLNTPIALSVLFELAHEINRLGYCDEARILANLLKKLGGLLGLLQCDPLSIQPLKSIDIDPIEIEAQIQHRNNARQKKQWDVADQIRQQLLEQGIALEDTPEGTRWKVY
jgi:cysteinyl-tRNA synthetase